MNDNNGTVTRIVVPLTAHTLKPNGRAKRKILLRALLQVTTTRQGRREKIVANFKKENCGNVDMADVHSHSQSQEPTARRFVTPDALTLFEVANVIRIRAKQLEHNAKPKVDLSFIRGQVSAITMAVTELLQGQLSMFFIRRWFPNGTFEDRCVASLRIPRLPFLG